uniref:Uncharacterized protein n=1 Tax=Myotis myotis TaxID=51298 RepID=A0A7J7R4A8_MYOMY|nr:hypothetical protein mMyoMyo1_010914 [Myotis myotis]
MIRQNHGLAASCRPRTGDQTCNPGLCPDQESHRDLLAPRLTLSHGATPARPLLNLPFFAEAHPSRPRWLCSSPSGFRSMERGPSKAVVVSGSLSTAQPCAGSGPVPRRLAKPSRPGSPGEGGHVGPRRRGTLLGATPLYQPAWLTWSRPQVLCWPTSAPGSFQTRLDPGWASCGRVGSWTGTRPCAQSCSLSDGLQGSEGLVPPTPAK